MNSRAKVFQLPEPFITKPEDADGIYTIVEFVKLQDGKIAMVTSKKQKRVTMVPVKKTVMARKRIPQYGDMNGVSVREYNPQILNLTNKQQRDEEKKKQVATSADSIIVCKHCGGPHWSRSCPHLGTRGSMGGDDSAPAAPMSTGRYMPPSLARAQASGAMGPGGRPGIFNEPCIRIDGLTDNTTEDLLRDILTVKIGKGKYHITRVKMPRDDVTQSVR
ncbi:eukaryotic translation initiation factor 3 subunit G [Kipferlia bialata]|uniref:Eukaryotic translation initiation factor 3 subunit G n=1 Tax=Kipferlia bialata TaxID=797122 RepID=A0A391NS25_9EUKA|nr:eukaryotic translation initiation factor 3 subunit G [Kipferlia bialata]|eukprot:g1504.t1